MNDFNYIPGIIFALVSLATIFGIMYLEDRDTKRRREEMRREDEEALGGPFVSSFD